ncbi:2-succinyl-5-enolpyruvyl-6-hydroxy-3-cyclohexene-1-carboxylic-acid synthase [Halapricum hydrolyticum]|uniref:2-succinyl-5-enolpyruvyl-6-hydroxy-3-cyclohexene-1-carboxylate synthase n=1 Tax=Halapricum hydrolyticum TaxID=2979991 RepID=A0AAE3LJ46_9EURY|nr:2-succinyl-5-enolpyruvyl-6-hydroxy-3-cyclohexene-1-carboxylic-acid synthase [Halapricum hydrolyticum]MCU4717799.1 2-succinyl-5-enolpyruvyl-6-hydroxy-3-cyclohexene-1-carboxylic-acid synthase [Halapricum hydrolyticum]MCU4726963.1 2-succinyl-5-enolpyruvyl-6-hydroxy-3-cyclohexene-1-carboxylic-acid synthase [Halapricum hydrolyticum]
MTAPNRATLWGETLVEELIAAGVTGVCLAPGSRSTPLTAAFAAHDGIETFSHLDERSAAFFALGRSRRLGEPTALVCTSGTAAANFHPAVIEAHQSRVPLVVLTADRPPELQDSGANQTIDQEQLYGDSVRWYRTLPEPKPEGRALRSLRVAADRAVERATGTPPGPVHLNVPVAKPLEPTETPGDVPDGLNERAPLGVEGRAGPFVRTTRGRPTLAQDAVESLADTLAGADRGLLVTGPTNRPTPSRETLSALAEATGFPVLADPLSGHRFGHDSPGTLVCGGYDSYLDAADAWPAPDVVVRFGASPTSKILRHYLRDRADRQFVIDPAGGWREAEFTATDLVTADPTWLADRLASRVADRLTERADSPVDADWRERFRRAERVHWEHVGDAVGTEHFEGAVLSTVASEAPDPATVVVSNSMPVRDLDRFARPRSADLTVLGNRGASGIDGVTSTALGAGSATDDPLVLVIGDLAFYHDMNGLLAVERCGVDATIVLLNNDGGGIFHMLSIEEFDPPFTEYFKTPHGIDFEPVGDLYGLEYAIVEDLADFEAAYSDSIESDGTQIIEIRFDADASHRTRERLHERVCSAVR